jgi:ribosomal protein S18 acetylase RimI-like enzyme
LPPRCQFFRFRTQTLIVTYAVQPDDVTDLFHIRESTPNDLPDLTTLLTVGFHQYLGPVNPLYWFMRASISADLHWRLHRPRPQYTCWLAEIESELGQRQVVGVAELEIRRDWPWQPTIVYVFNLTVHPQWRRRGIATALLNTCEARTQTWGFSSLQLHVLASNQKAQHLYEKLGYVQQGVERGWDYWLMGSSPRLFLVKGFNAIRIVGPV